MKTHEQYMVAILSNPEWMKHWAESYNRGGQSFGAPELAKQVKYLHDHLADLLDVDEDAGEST
jgi:hypothetical protein